MNSYLQKISIYIQAVCQTKSLNWMGMPCLSKATFKCLPYNREHYNQFILWMNSLDLPPATQILDIGANHGDFSEAASTLYPQAKIWLFEPLPKLHSELEQRSLRHKGNWQICKYALGNETKELELHIDPERDDIASLKGFNTSYTENSPIQSNVETFTCQVLPLDEITNNFDTQTIDLIKIDVEGFEFEVMKGAQQSLQHTRAVIIEVSLMRDADSSQESRLIQMLTLLENSGLQIAAILPSWFHTHHPWLPVEYNILARRIN